LQPWISFSDSNGEVPYYVEIPQVDCGNLRKGIDLQQKGIQVNQAMPHLLKWRGQGYVAGNTALAQTMPLWAESMGLS
jgi:hypothetical protein